MPHQSSARPTRTGVTPVHVLAGSRTDTGPNRANNQDCVAVWPETPGDRPEKGVLALVADGMGGHKGGEIASGIASKTIPMIYSNHPAQPQEALLRAFETANEEIYLAARKNGSLAGMGTTCTAVAVVKGQAYLAHIGDSRMYLVRAGAIYVMTDDHSATRVLVKQGLLPAAEAKQHDERNVILRAMGTRPKVEVETWSAPFSLWPGDRLVLCSDGLYETIADEEIAGAATRHLPQDACRELIRLAVERNTSDNATVSILALESGLETTVETDGSR